MKVSLPLDQMTTAEKFEAMEVIWQNLSQDQTQFGSPAWHGKILGDREQAVREGREMPMEWEQAKEQLRALRA